MSKCLLLNFDMPLSFWFWHLTFLSYSIAQNLQAWMQERQRMHFSRSITAVVFFSQAMASEGQAFLQRPHILHLSESTRNLIRSAQTREGHRLSMMWASYSSRK